MIKEVGSLQICRNLAKIGSKIPWVFINKILKLLQALFQFPLKDINTLLGKNPENQGGKLEILQYLKIQYNCKKAQ